MDRKFRLLLVGYGARGRSWQTELGSHPDFEVTSVVDPDRGARADAMAVGLTPCSTLAEGLSSPELDAALIASPPTEHVRDAIACVRASLAVLVEKPVATTSEDAALVARQAQVSGRPVLVAQNFRFLPREMALRVVLRSRGLGRLHTVEVRSARPAPPRQRWDLGPLWEFVLHHLDAIRVRVGRLPDEVGARRRDVGGRECWEISLRWTDGPSIAYRHLEGAPYRYLERIEADGGRLVVDDRGVRLRRRRRLPRWVRAPRLRAEKLVLDELSNAMRGGSSGLDAADNVATVALVEAVERSAHDGRAVDIRTPNPD